MNNKQDDLTKAIIKTVKYAHHFGGGLTRDELLERLLSRTAFSKKNVSRKLKAMSQKRLKINKTKPKWQEVKIKKATDYVAKYLAKNSSILLVGISGSVAAGYSKEGDDIDFFLVTKKNRLWITRLGLKIQLWLNRIPHRKRGQKEKKDEFCFNLWLDEEGLTLPAGKQNMKNAVDLMMLKPILGRNDIYKRLLISNSWVERYTASGYQKKLKRARRTKHEVNKKDGWVVSQLNKLCYWGQYGWMKRNLKNEIINLHQAFFHPNG